MLDLYRPSWRATAAIVVLLAWVASLGWLGVRQLGQSEETTLSSQAALRLSPGTVWYALYAGETQVGNAAVTLDTLSPGYLVSESVMLVDDAGGPELDRATRRTEIWLGSTLNVERMHSRYSREKREADWDVTVFGDTLTARFSDAASRVVGHALFDEPPTAAWVLPYRLALGGGLVTGQQRNVTLMDGWPMAGAPAHVTVGKDSLIRFSDSSRFNATAAQWEPVHFDSARSYAVTVNGAAGPRRFWVDRHGIVAKIETPFGLRWARTDFDLSETDFRKRLVVRTPGIRAALPTLMPYTNIARADTGTAPRRYLVQHRDGSPVDTSLLRLLQGGRQTVHGDTIIVLAAGPMLAGERKTDTLPDPAIQLEPAAIGSVQHRLVQQPLTPERMPHFLQEFRALVRVDTAVHAPEDALGTLRRAARPDGITRLFVALLRDSNVPARYVVGVYPRGDTLWTHSWAEVWDNTANGWAAVDPVSGSAVATTGLIRLAFAGSSHPDDIMALLANARFTDVTAGTQP